MHPITRQIAAASAAFLSLCHARIADAGPNAWTPIGPSGGIVSAIAVSPSAPAIVYAGTDPDGFSQGGAGNGSVFKSTNGGASWTLTALVESVEVTAIAVHPSDPSYVLSTGNGGTFRSTDGGQSWAVVGSGMETLVFDSSDPDVVYGGTTFGGVLKSTDGGVTFTQHSNGLVNLWVRTVAVDPQTPSTVYCGAGDGVYKSIDGAQNWTVTGLGGQGIYTVAIDPATPATVYAVASLGTYKSIDGGASWSLLFAGTALRLVIDPLTPSTLYVGAFTGGLSKSIDAGASWSPSSAGVDPMLYSLAIDPQTPSNLYYGSSGSGIYRTLDGAGSWSESNAGLTGVNISALRGTSVAGRLYASSRYFSGGGGVYATTDAGATWTRYTSAPLNTNVSTLAVDPTAPLTAYAGTVTGVYKTMDGGSTWTGSLPGIVNDFVWALAIDPVSPTTIYAAKLTDGVFKSIDGASTWAATGLTGGFITTLLVDSSQPSTVYAGTGGGVFKSVDAGATWAASSTGLGSPWVQALVMHPTNPAILYAGTHCAGVFKSVDAGGTWSLLGEPGTCVEALAVDPVTPSRLYLAPSGFGVRGVRQSVDGGTTWTPMGLDDFRVQHLLLDPFDPLTLYAGTSGTSVYHLAIGPDCGDGIVAPGEQCDDGNESDEDTCTTACLNNVCGDGFVRTGVEECDDGNANDDDACLTSCEVAECGDGFTRTGMEECDDDNLVDGDGCEADCTLTMCAAGVALDGAHVALKKLGGASGDEVITLKGRLAFPLGVPPIMNPAAKGAQVLVEDVGAGDARVFELTRRTDAIPAGAPGGGCDPKDGWSVSGSGLTYVYRNRSGALDPPGCTTGSAKGLALTKVSDKRSTRSEVGFKLLAKKATVPALVGPLRVTFVLGASAAESIAGECGVALVFCTTNATGTTKVCR
jgi:cysteine-rich repeat protein